MTGTLAVWPWRETPAGAAGPASGAAFAEPAVLQSNGGALDVDLVAAARKVPWGDGRRYVLAYNGEVPGPTIRVRPGDVLTVRLRNDLDEPTNLHTHGLHVSPSGDGDNIFVMVEPGSTHTYTYRIPDDHPPGTFWYHPHHHGTVAAQVSGGLAGMIVVEDPADSALARLPERVLVLSDPKIGTTPRVLSATRAQQMQGREGTAMLVNGLLRPAGSARAGTAERWRVVNASPSRYYDLALDGAAMEWIGTDQGYFDQPRSAESILLTPGQRAQVVVSYESPGTVRLTTGAYDRGSMSMGGMGRSGGMMGGSGGMGMSRSATRSAAAGSTDLMSVIVTDGSGVVPPLSSLPETGLTAGMSTRTRTVTVGAMGMGMREFVIDGKSFDPERVDLSPRLGTTETWVLRNGSMMDHPFHLHVWPFRVIERSDGRAPDPGWHDTINLPVGGSVTIEVAFGDFGGRTVYHCHILDHEDLGMMGVIEVA